jgi:hypothetical protein
VAPWWRLGGSYAILLHLRCTSPDCTSPDFLDTTRYRRRGSVYVFGLLCILLKLTSSSAVKCNIGAVPLIAPCRRTFPCSSRPSHRPLSATTHGKVPQCNLLSDDVERLYQTRNLLPIFVHLQRTCSDPGPRGTPRNCCEPNCLARARAEAVEFRVTYALDVAKNLVDYLPVGVELHRRDMRRDPFAPTYPIIMLRLICAQPNTMPPCEPQYAAI